MGAGVSYGKHQDRNGFVSDTWTVGEAAFAAQWKVCASEKRPPSSVTRSAEEKCQCLFFKICLHFKIIKEKQVGTGMTGGDCDQFGQNSSFPSCMLLLSQSQLFISCASISEWM